MCVVRTACMYAHAYMCISTCITAPVCVCVTDIIYSVYCDPILRVYTI